jgi:hypothetical protein
MVQADRCRVAAKSQAIFDGLAMEVNAKSVKFCIGQDIATIAQVHAR